MKRMFFVSIFIFFIMAPTTTHAWRKAPLGNSNFAFKLDAINMTDDFWEDDTLPYVGLEGFWNINTNLYLGGEIGTGPLGGVSTEPFINISFIPHVETEADIIFLEINLKYAKSLGSHFVIDLGAGLSYNYVEVSYETHDPAVITHIIDSREETDWLFGGQIFADLNCKINWFFVGVNAKYQMTEDYQVSEVISATGFKSDFDLSNWKIGVQVGIIF